MRAPEPDVSVVAELFPLTFQLVDEHDAGIWRAVVEGPTTLRIPTRGYLRLRAWDSSGGRLIHDRVDPRPCDWRIGQLPTPEEVPA